MYSWTLITLGKNFSRRQIKTFFFLIFPKKKKQQALTFQANCLQWKWLACNVKSCFLGKIGKNIIKFLSADFAHKIIKVNFLYLLPLRNRMSIESHDAMGLHKTLMMPVYNLLHHFYLYFSNLLICCEVHYQIAKENEFLMPLLNVIIKPSGLWKQLYIRLFVYILLLPNTKAIRHYSYFWYWPIILRIL